MFSNIQNTGLLFCLLFSFLLIIPSLVFGQYDTDSELHSGLPSGSQTCIDNGSGNGLDDLSLENTLRDYPEDTPQKAPAKKQPVKPTTTRNRTSVNRTSSTNQTSTTNKTSTNRTSSNQSSTTAAEKRRMISEQQRRNAKNKEEEEEEEELVEIVVTGVGGLALLSVAGYAMGAIKGAAVVEGAATAVKGAAMVKGGVGLAANATADSISVMTGNTLMPDGTIQYGDGTNSADFANDGEFAEPTENVNVKPSKGATRSYVDKNDTRWVEVFDGQNWIDKASFENAGNKVLENEQWHKEQHLKQINHDTAFDRGLEQQKSNHEAELKDIHQRNDDIIRKNMKMVQNTNKMLRRMANQELARIETINDVLDIGKALADTALPVVGSIAGGPIVWGVGATYTMATSTGAGIATGIVEPGKGIIAEGLKGVAEGAVNLIVSEGLNSAMAIGSRAFRGAARALPRYDGFKASYNAVKFHASVPVKEVGQFVENLKSGMSLTKSIDMGSSFSTVSDVASSFSVTGNSLTSTAGRNTAAKAFSNLGYGIFSSIKGTFVDSGIGNYVNNGLWP